MKSEKGRMEEKIQDNPWVVALHRKLQRNLDGVGRNGIVEI